MSPSNCAHWHNKVRHGSETDLLSSRNKALSPCQEYVDYLGIVTWVRPHPNVFRAQPKQIISDIFSVDGAFEKLKYLGNIAFILIPGLWDASNADWIPHVVEDFVDSVEKLFVLWQKFQCLIPDQTFVDVRFGSKADITFNPAPQPPRLPMRTIARLSGQLRRHDLYAECRRQISNARLFPA